MNFIKLLWLILAFCAMSKQSMAMEQRALTSSLYIKNASEYPVRICVGPEYPSSIALYPGQILEFPIKDIPGITASTYGKVSHYLTGLVAELNILQMLQDCPQYADHDCYVEIVYEKNSPRGTSSLWRFARYLFTLGKWSLSHRILEEKDLATYALPASSEALSRIIAQLSGSAPEEIIRDAALIWSMFPRAASKIENRQTVYPFNILGLDIGGLIASDKQLRNWGSLLAGSLQKKYSSITSPAIWNAVRMIIADSVESFRQGNYYHDRDPQYPVTLLYIPTAESPESQAEPAFPADIIDKLKGKIVGDQAAEALLCQLEQAARSRGWTGLVRHEQPVIPPAPPIDGFLNKSSYQEHEVERFLRELAEKKLEAQSVFDKVAKELFDKIDHLELDAKQAVQLKYAALDRLRLIDQGKHALSELAKVRDYFSPAMIRVAYTAPNPTQSMQDMISWIARSDRERGYEYARMQDQQLTQAFKLAVQQQDYQTLLMQHLRQQIRRFESPAD
jgi:hypothetical protein